ncbi:hypothetical protein GCM10027569_72090 [Flindersiella endophytica]
MPNSDMLEAVDACDGGGDLQNVREVVRSETKRRLAQPSHLLACENHSDPGPLVGGCQLKCRHDAVTLRYLYRHVINDAQQATRVVIERPHGLKHGKSLWL